MINIIVIFLVLYGLYKLGSYKPKKIADKFSSIDRKNLSQEGNKEESIPKAPEMSKEDKEFFDQIWKEAAKKPRSQPKVLINQNPSLKDLRLQMNKQFEKYFEYIHKGR